jgi:hypothetical protein
MEPIVKATESIGYYEFKRFGRPDVVLDQRASYSFDKEIRDEMYKTYLNEETIRKATLDVENQ